MKQLLIPMLYKEKDESTHQTPDDPNNTACNSSEPTTPELEKSDGQTLNAAPISHDLPWYRPAVENNTFYVTKTDLQGNYTFMDSFFCEMLGVKAQDHLGRNSLELILPEDHEACLETVRKCMAQPEAIQRVVLRKPTPKGIIVNQWVFNLIRDEHGHPFEFLCIGHEITDLMQKQRLLEAQVVTIGQQNSRLQNFTHIVSHNIRSHVANLNSIIDLTDMADEQDRRLSFGLIKNTVNALDETIGNLNEIISIQANTNLPFGPVNVADAVGKVTHSIYALLKNANATVHCNFGRQEELETNPAYFESILLNLITNAVKYRSPERDPHITISMGYERGCKVLAIQDNGSGIDLKRHREKVFGLYKTFHGNKDAKGMGLFITKAQVEAMKGTIEVESEPGQGTTFKMYFDESI